MFPGPVGIVSRSGSVSYEVIDQLSAAGYGQSTVVCIGGDPFVGTTYQDVLRLFARDPQTELIIMLGEVGGDDEIRAAEVMAVDGKPVVAYIAGHAAPTGRSMGHAGAIIRRSTDTAGYKEERLRELGVHVAPLVTEVVPLVDRLFRRHDAPRRLTVT